METTTLAALTATAAFLGFLHTLTGPDHYLPFVAMARAGRWSLRKTLLVTLTCGLGHVLGSVVLGMLGVALGLAVTGLEWLEGMRGSLAGWMLLGCCSSGLKGRGPIRAPPAMGWGARARL